MKKIVLACGAGAATSTLVAQKVATMLDANGYAGKYEIVQCAISEAKDACDEGADLLIATTVCPRGPHLPVRERRALHDRHEPRRCREGRSRRYGSVGAACINEQNANPVELFGMRVAHVGITPPTRPMPGDRGAVLDDDGPTCHRDPGFVL